MTNTTQSPQSSLYPIAFGIKTNLVLLPRYEDILYKRGTCIREALLLSLCKYSTDDAGAMESIVHLLRMDGIKLTVMHKNGLDVLRKIEVRVDVLLGGLNDFQPSEDDFEIILNVVKNLVTCILHDPKQSEQILPDARYNGARDSRSSWSLIECRVHMASVHFSCLRNLDHPAAKGVPALETKGGIQLGHRENRWVLRVEETTEGKYSCDKKRCLQTPLCFTLTLIDDRLRSILSGSGFSVFDSLTGAGRLDLARVVKNQMSQLRGYVLPMFQGDPDEERIVKFARVIAFATKGNPKVRKELLRTAGQVYADSSGYLTDSICDEFTKLKRAVLAESSRLKNIKLSKLFTIEAITTRVAPWRFYLRVPVHPLIESAQGLEFDEPYFDKVDSPPKSKIS